MSLYLAGAGGFGRETYDVVLAQGGTIAAFLDDRLAGTVVRGVEALAPERMARGAGFTVGIADPAGRRRLVAVLNGREGCARTLVHPRAAIGPEITLGDGVVVLAGAHVSSSVRLADHVQVNYNATIGHDAVLDEYVTVYPGANVSGAVHLEPDVTIGSNACVLQGRTVAAGAVVGAGAVVTHDALAGQVVVGAPARPLPR
jgi:sugar O-acyltransferase (sialic acid O-acetyltransferase NeuD family)